jgi:hypothetical protein
VNVGCIVELPPRNAAGRVVESMAWVSISTIHAREDASTATSAGHREKRTEQRSSVQGGPLQVESKTWPNR